MSLHCACPLLDGSHPRPRPRPAGAVVPSPSLVAVPAQSPLQRNPYFFLLCQRRHQAYARISVRGRFSSSFHGNQDAKRQRLPLADHLLAFNTLSFLAISSFSLPPFKSRASVRQRTSLAPLKFRCGHPHSLYNALFHARTSRQDVCYFDLRCSRCFTVPRAYVDSFSVVSRDRAHKVA